MLLLIRSPTRIGCHGKLIFFIRLVESESGDGRFWVYGRQTDTSPLAAFEFKYYSSSELDEHLTAEIDSH